MDITNAVSETALFTLRARVLESQRDDPVIADPEGATLLAAIGEQLGDEARARVLDRKMPSSLTVHLALRARYYDRHARAFMQAHPGGLVVSLGAGFDTRYWRVSDEAWPYVEVDLPEVIEAKHQLLGQRARYEMIGCSVLDHAWIDEVRARQEREVLFIAEGLFMYLPKPQVIELFSALAAGFSSSELLFEVVHERYTQGMWKKMVERKMKRRMGSEAGSSFQYGVGQACEIEAYADGIEVLDEWSYFEDPDVRPRILRLFRNWKFVSRTQWTIRASLG